MKTIKSLLYKIGLIFSWKPFLKIIKQLQYFKNIFYSGYISGQLAKHGKDPYFMYPAFVKGGEYIEIGNGFYSKPGFRIEAVGNYAGGNFVPKITIGNNVLVNDSCHFGCINEITIGNNVMIASRVFITDHFHGTSTAEDAHIAPNSRPLVSKGKVVIEDDVWLGECVTVMPGVTIGKGSIVGANSVVTKDIAPYSVVGGVPAKLIRSLLKE